MEEEIIARTVRLARLQYDGASDREVAEAIEEIYELQDDYDPAVFIDPPKRRGPGRPIDHRIDFVYHHARILWMYLFGRSWSTSVGDRVNGPLFDDYGGRRTNPDNAAAKFLVAFASDVSPSIAPANCNGAHERLRRVVLGTRQALDDRRRRQRERKRARV